MCIALSCSVFPKASRRKHSCADRWEKIAGICCKPRWTSTLPNRCAIAPVWDSCNRSGTNISSVLKGGSAFGLAPPSRVLSGSFRPMRPMRVPAASARPNGWVTSVHLTETCGEEDAVHLIMQAEITPATEQDVEETMPLLDDLQARNLVPEVRLVDSGASRDDVPPKP